MPAPRASPSGTRLSATADGFTPSFYANDAEVARGGSNAAALREAGFTGAGASSFGITAQSASAACGGAGAQSLAAPSFTGRTFSPVKYHGLPAFFDSANNTFWDGENSWSYGAPAGASACSTGTQFATGTHFGASGNQFCASGNQFGTAGTNFASGASRGALRSHSGANLATAKESNFTPTSCYFSTFGPGC